MYDVYTQAGFDPDKDLLQAPVMAPDAYGPKPWWAGQPMRQWRESGFLVDGGGVVFDWDLRTTLEGLYAAGVQLAGGADHMAVKGRAGRSGLTPWANSWFVFKDTKGVTREQYLQQFVLAGEYLNNMDFVDILMAESYDRYLEVSAWGAQTGREYYYQPGTVTRSIEVVGAGDALRKQTVASGVGLLERVMITSLIKPEERVLGAVGFHMESGHPYAILAGATVMAAGPASFKPLGLGYPCSAATADGDAMAYRVGAEISGKEFNDAHPARGANPLAKPDTRPSPMLSATELGGGPPGPSEPADRLDGRHLGLRIGSALGVHNGGVPPDPRFCSGPGSFPVGGGGEPPGLFGDSPGISTPGMSNHKGEGVFPQDLSGASNVPGLWAAGDALCSMQNGAGYAGFGCSCAGSSVAGGARGESGRRARRSRGGSGGRHRPARDSLQGHARALVQAARVFTRLGDSGDAGDHVPLLRDVREGAKPPGGRAQPDHASAGGLRAGAEGRGPARAPSGSRDPEHASKRRDETACRTRPGREPGHALS